MAPRPVARKPKSASGIAPALLAWYDRHHRELPWRTSPSDMKRGVRPDPYRVWLSEIMLQQTTVAAVKPYFAKFVDKWPDIASLAAAEADALMKAWAGLGYYSRARNLKKCADVVADRFGGRFPDTVEALRSLPGVGDYTAGAIAAIAFDRPAAVVDGNVERVISRLFAIDTPLPDAKPAIRAIVETLVPETRPGDFAQAMMDLGATICTPRRPACVACPVNDECAALKTGDPELYPRRVPKTERPLRRGAAFVAVRPDGAILLRKRPDKGLLAGMAEVPTSGWTARIDGGVTLDDAPFAADWRRAGEVAHVFTHFELALTVYVAAVTANVAPAGAWWASAAKINDEALPTVMKKAIEAALPGSTKAPHLLANRRKS
jgi:A/G-specific adenine glycosylase